MKCINCGNEVNNNIEFCPNCGNKLTPNKKGNIGIIIASVLIIALIGVIGITLGNVILKGGKNNNQNTDITNTTAFFLNDSDNKFALFNEDGKKLTDFIFTSKSEFINGAAIVKKDDNYGIISESGKMVVDFGKYRYVDSASGLYEVTDNNGNEYLINNKGKILYDLKESEVTTFLTTNNYLILKNKDTYYILNYNGDKLLSFNAIEDLDKPTTNEDNGIITVFYNKKNYIINTKNKNKVISFDSDIHYCADDIESQNDLIILNSCVGMFEKQDKTYYKILKNEKIYDVDSECETLYYQNTLSCSKNYEEYSLDDNYKLNMKINDKAYYKNNYVQNKDGAFNGVDFYKDNKLIKNVSCRSLSEKGYMTSNIYILGTYYSVDCNTDSGIYEFYNENGEKLFNKSYKDIEPFDKNNLAQVSEDGKNYYLIDTSGKQIGDIYSRILFSNDYYRVTKNDKIGLIDKNGKEIIPCEYSEIDIREFNNKLYALANSDTNYEIYDIKKSEKISSFDSSPILTAHYIQINKNDSKEYYTYNGKKFYENR